MALWHRNRHGIYGEGAQGSVEFVVSGNFVKEELQKLLGSPIIKLLFIFIHKHI